MCFVFFSTLSNKKSLLIFYFSFFCLFVLVRYCSVDPYMRIQQAASKTWEDPHPTGQVQGSGTVLRVVHSNVEGVTPGQIFLGYTGWQKYGEN
ncbi:MAG: hypothetical protein Q8P67_09800 [archaeon]|nr:hypothetical protein [archaeon]